ncbi:Uncharacterised protein [Vibrio cholerae]|nr:Uncharacterised protein [Vibrio cholerae]
MLLSSGRNFTFLADRLKFFWINNRCSIAKPVNALLYRSQITRQYVVFYPDLPYFS